MLTRWFRRNQKYMLFLLAGMMIVGMVGWGTYGSIQRLIQRRAGNIGKVRGETVSAMDIYSARAELVLLQRIRQPDSRGDVARFIFDGTVMTDPSRPPVLTDKAVWRYLVLLQEARAAGIQITSDEMAPVAALGRDMQSACANLVRINKLLAYKQGSVQMSETELWSDYLFQQETVQVSYVALDPDELRPVVEVSGEEVERFYEDYKDLAPDEEKGTPGYLAPERVALEYAVAELPEFEKRVTVTDEEIEADYEQNKESYKLPEEPAVDTEIESPDILTAEPQYKPLAEVKEKIRDEVKSRKTREAAEDAAQKALDYINSVRERYGNEPLPLERAARKYDLTYTRAKSESGERFVTQEDFAALLPGDRTIGESIFGQAKPLDRIVMRAQTPTGSPILYQTVDRKPAAPWPLEKVRDRVSDDLETRKAVDYTETLADKLLTRAREDSLEKAVEEMNERLDSLLKRTKPATPEATETPEADQDEEGDADTGEEDGETQPEEMALMLDVRTPRAFSRLSPYIAGIPPGHRLVAQEASKLEVGAFAKVVERSGRPACYVVHKVAVTPAAPEGFHKWASSQGYFAGLGKQWRVQQEWLDRLAEASPPPTPRGPEDE